MVILQETIKARHGCNEGRYRDRQRWRGGIGKEILARFRLIVIDLYLEGLLCLRNGTVRVNEQVIRIRCGDGKTLGTEIIDDRRFTRGKRSIEGCKGGGVQVVMIEGRLGSRDLFNIRGEIGLVPQVQTYCQ